MQDLAGFGSGMTIFHTCDFSATLRRFRNLHITHGVNGLDVPRQVGKVDCRLDHVLQAQPLTLQDALSILVISVCRCWGREDSPTRSDARGPLSDVRTLQRL